MDVGKNREKSFATHPRSIDARQVDVCTGKIF